MSFFVQDRAIYSIFDGMPDDSTSSPVDALVGASVNATDVNIEILNLTTNSTVNSTINSTTNSTTNTTIQDPDGNLHNNGTQTLGENIADNGGIKIAYDAFQKLLESSGTKSIFPKLPGLKLTQQQLFFVSFAHMWCDNSPEFKESYSVASDEHSLPRFRVKGVLQNFPEFSEAFSCKKKSFMNPDEKCSLW